MVPAFTWSPAATGSEVTVPLTANDRSERRAGAIVPEAETLSRMVLLVALTRVGAAVPDDDERRAAQVTPPPMTTSVMTTATIVCRLLKARALRRTGVPFVARGPFPAGCSVLPLAGSTLTAGCRGSHAPAGPLPR